MCLLLLGFIVVVGGGRLFWVWAVCRTSVWPMDLCLGTLVLGLGWGLGLGDFVVFIALYLAVGFGLSGLI